MRRRTITWMVTIAITSVLLTGCTQQLKERIVLLEDANSSLVGKLGEVERSLTQCRDDRGDLLQQFADCTADGDQLRAELSAVPEPQPQTQEPSAPEGWTAVHGGGMIALASDVVFTSGSTKLKPEAQLSLGAIAGVLGSTYADKDVLVFGHTDSVPIKKSGFDDNYQLSTERALAVVRHLASCGIPAKRLVACGCGEHRPLVPNTNDGNMTRNRRVEIFAITLEN